ncbi:hypothetical protein [Paracoccus fontiphilus]|uniref:hypothetical protein n=1 Tax=Paracoccus fontiphilus TaxID=1815556 RepID=UPI00366C9893
MGERLHYLPRASVLRKLSVMDQALVLDANRRRLEEEAGRYVLQTCVGRRKVLRSARDRMRRLTKTANELGHWLDEVAA